MTIVADLKKTVTDVTPVYAAVGVTDLAAEMLRDARMTARAARQSIVYTVSPKTVQKSVQDAPAVALNRTLELAGKAQAQYEDLAARGESLVKRLRSQQATQDLVNQVDQTVVAGKGAVTTVRKAVTGTQAAAKATITTGRHQAARVADVASDAVSREAKDVAKSAEAVADVAAEGAKKTATSAKRARTTARKGAKATTARTKATTTSARKTAPRARKATAAGAKKVGS